MYRIGDMDDMFGQMDRMMNQMMGGMFNPSMNMAMSPFGMNTRNMIQFPGMPNMMPMMQPHSFQNMTMSGNPGSFYSSSSVVSFSGDGQNPPQVYEETQMNRLGPGGVREERRTVRDSNSGLQQMSIGRHIHDRGHVMERKKNHRTGEEEENNEFINIEEEEAPEFNQEWSSQMQNSYSNEGGRYIQAPRRQPVLAITGPQDSPNFSYNSPGPSTSHQSEKHNKKLKVKPINMKKDKKGKKNFRKD